MVDRGVSLGLPNWCFYSLVMARLPKYNSIGVLKMFYIRVNSRGNACSAIEEKESTARSRAKDLAKQFSIVYIEDSLGGLVCEYQKKDLRDFNNLES